MENQHLKYMTTENKYKNVSMNRFIDTKIVLGIIILIALISRFYMLGSYPALNADEAAIGYNAYSLLETGMDEHGNPWPIHFQSFNDYKPGLYMYLAMPFVAVFGLDVFWIRFPGALLGILSVSLIYFLIKELFTNKLSMINGQRLAIFASFLLAINPWHIHFSRGGWEVNVATFFILAGVYCFLRWVNSSQHKDKNHEGKHSSPFQGEVGRGLFSDILDKHIYPLLISILFFVLSLYTYHAARVVAPLLGLGLFIVYFDSIKKNSKQVLIAVFFGVVLLIPLISDLTGPAGFSRASGVSIFADAGVVNRINERRGSYEDPAGLTAKTLHNKPIYYTWEFVQNWTEHFYPKFLFLEGDVIQRNKVPNMGQMYIFDILLIPLGIVFLLRKKLISRVYVLWWLAIAPIAAALTFQSPHALRAQNMVIPLVILSALGLYYVLEFLKYHHSKKIYVLCSLFFVLVISWSFTHYQNMYWNNMAKEYPFSSQYGVEQLVDYVKDNKQDGQKVVVTDRYDQPYILFLFYMNYPPEQFQREHTLTERDEFGFSTVREFGDFHFVSMDYEEVLIQYSNAIIAGTDEEIPDEASIIDEIYGKNGYKYFVVIEN